MWHFTGCIYCSLLLSKGRALTVYSLWLWARLQLLHLALLAEAVPVEMVSAHLWLYVLCYGYGSLYCDYSFLLPLTLPKEASFRHQGFELVVLLSDKHVLPIHQRSSGLQLLQYSHGYSHTDSDSNGYTSDGCNQLLCQSASVAVGERARSTSISNVSLII